MRISGSALAAPGVAELNRVYAKRLGWEAEELAGLDPDVGVSGRIAGRWRSAWP